MSQKKVYKNTSLLSIIRQETGGRCDQMESHTGRFNYKTYDKFWILFFLTSQEPKISIILIAAYSQIVSY